MKFVAVSQRVDSLSDRNETRDSVDQRLTAWLNICGFIPIQVPNCLGTALIGWLGHLRPCAIVLSGGNDIGQCFDRDNTELMLLAYAEENHLPLLGICRGMQMLAHYYGVNLIPVGGHVRTRHFLTGIISGEVNSYHGYALATCPDGFEVLATSEDGSIEAIRHLFLPWEGWMWHPEREPIFDADNISRLKILFHRISSFE